MRQGHLETNGRGKAVDKMVCYCGDKILQWQSVISNLNTSCGRNSTRKQMGRGAHQEVRR